MSMDSGQYFVQWLDEQEKRFEYSDYEVAKKGDFSHSALSRARTENIPPGYSICMKIAGVFNVSPTTVLRKAGLLPAEGGDQIRFDDWQYLLNQLPEDEREDLRLIAEAKLQKVKKQKGLKKLNPQKAG